MIRDAETITKKLGLGICGVDIMWNQQTNKYYLIEVNATPGIDIHDDPFSGTSSDCVERYVDWLIA
jgi:D-alanine-D-alanine ligase-like ATP-grasp enzyme